jgi:hypothetical protein
MERRLKTGIVFLILMLFRVTIIIAQNCPENPDTKKGVWIQNKDGGFNDNRAHPEALKNKKNVSMVLDSIAGLLKKYNPQPEGSYAKWIRLLKTDLDSVSSPDPAFANYEIESWFLPYICNKGLVEPFNVTDTWLYVDVNDYWCSGHTLQHEMNDALGEKLFTLPIQAGTLGGYPVFEPTPKGEKDSPWLVFYSVLIHQPGKLPYVPVTKHEFFEINRKLIDKKETEYKAGIERQRKSMGEDWYTERVGQIKKQFQGMRDNLDQLMKLYEKEMDQPAILRQWEWELRGIEIANPTQKKLFTTANRGYQLVRANPDYMDQSQAKWKPQFMWVEWFKVVGKPNSVALDKVMHEQFDFKELGKLLTH